jgi:hypothetical protein
MGCQVNKNHSLVQWLISVGGTSSGSSKGNTTKKGPENDQGQVGSNHSSRVVNSAS